MVSHVEAPRRGAPSAHAPGDASVSTSGGVFVSGQTSVTERKNALAASAYVGERLVSRAKDTRRRVKERDEARSLVFGVSEARIRAHGGGKPPDDAAPTAEGNEVAPRPPRPPVGDRPLGIARSDDPDRVTRRVAAYGNPKISARRAVLRWRALGAATQDTADAEHDEPRSTGDSDSDVVVPRPPASPSRPGFKSQARRVVIASRFVRRAREAADLDISPRPGPPPTRLESLPPESPSAPSPRVDEEAAPADEVPEESDVDATSSGCVTPREDGIPEEEGEENIPVESLASEGDGSPRARASDVVRKLRDAANELSKTPRAERADDAVRDAVARAVDASAMESPRMTRSRASAPDAPRVPSPPRDARPEGGAVGRAAAMLKSCRTDGEKRRRRTNARRRRTRGSRRWYSTRRRSARSQPGDFQARGGIESDARRRTKTASNPRARRFRSRRFRRPRCRFVPNLRRSSAREATHRFVRICARRRTAAEAPRRRARGASRG